MDKISTVKLGAYPASFTLELFEEEGYVKYEDLDKYFEECYCEFETYLDKQAFIKNSKRNLLNSIKYKQFMNNEVKMCSKCFKVKPLDSFYSKKKCLYGKSSNCSCCEIEKYNNYKSTEKGSEARKAINKRYYQKNKDKFKESASKWKKANRFTVNIIQNRYRMKKKLEENGYSLEDADELDFLVRFKQENNIKSYEEVFKRLESILNSFKL